MMWLLEFPIKKIKTKEEWEKIGRFSFNLQKRKKITALLITITSLVISKQPI